ncbi:type VI secretion system PAAR protein [Aeromonas rivuli]|uniref:type VI secretion system PAAR protein n=1 Tax=Aeromonas rivuli TaxID=648794 RepID=UPI000A011CDC|nr:type VI secretion system PAAR protein [Aeromonas rivuli]
MSKKAATIGDIGTDHDGFAPSPIITGSPDIIIDNKPAARVGDKLAPHTKPGSSPHDRAITTGSSTVFFNGQPAALTGSEIGCGGLVIGGSSVFIGDLAPGGAGEAVQNPLTTPELLCVFAKSCSVPPTTIEAATGPEPISLFGRVLVLAPMPSSAS